MVSEQEICEIVVTLLESNITDPLSGRLAKGKKWIYDDPARLDLAEYPRISVTPAQSNYEEFATGVQAQQLEKSVIVIEVYGRKQDKINVKGTSATDRGEQVVDYLANQVRSVIKNNHATFITNGILSLRPETKNRSIVGDLLIERMTFRAQVVN